MRNKYTSFETEKKMIELYYVGQNRQWYTACEGGSVLWGKNRESVLQDRVRNTRSLHQLYKTAIYVSLVQLMK